jgi:hypothetical protein
MGSRIYFVIAFLINLSLSIILIISLNKVLLIIYGYHVDSKSLTPEAFKAYRGIYGSKVIIIVMGLISSVLVLYFAKKYAARNSYLVDKIIYLVSWLIAIIFLISCFFMIFLPNGPLV